jgi:hypothetical protein
VKGQVVVHRLHMEVVMMMMMVLSPFDAGGERRWGGDAATFCYELWMICYNCVVAIRCKL